MSSVTFPAVVRLLRYPDATVGSSNPVGLIVPMYATLYVPVDVGALPVNEVDALLRKVEPVTIFSPEL